MTMHEFTLMMTTFVSDRPMVNQTGLDGRYDFDLKYTYDESKSPADGGAPGLFTAMEEQLGLKLETKRAPADVMVVEKVERPGAN